MGKGTLEVFLVDAKGLKNTEFIGKMDPYVIMEYTSQEHKSNVARGQGSNPVWKETFEFAVHYASDVVDCHHKLTLRIMDKDIFTADDFVGEATINVGDFISLGIENGIAEQVPTKYPVVLADRTYHGEIRVGLKFIPELQMQEQEENQELGGWKDSFRY